MITLVLIDWRIYVEKSSLYFRNILSEQQTKYIYVQRLDKIMERPLICHTCVICIMTYKSDVLIILSDPCNLL